MQHNHFAGPILLILVALIALAIADTHSTTNRGGELCLLLTVSFIVQCDSICKRVQLSTVVVQQVQVLHASKQRSCAFWSYTY